MAFEQIIGNSKIKETLNSIIQKNSILHGYMFIGAEGIGKKIFATEFAKMLLCTSETAKPCNQCKSCIEFAGNSNPDFKIIEPDGTSLKIDQIRQMQSKILDREFKLADEGWLFNY